MDKIALIKEYIASESATGRKPSLAEAKQEVERRLAAGEYPPDHVPDTSGYSKKPSKKPSNPRQADALVAFVLAAIATWALPQFVLIPLLQAFGISFSWWMYALLFLTLLGGVGDGLTKQRAHENQAYGSPQAAGESAARFCPKCGRAVSSSDAFCPGCGKQM